MKVMKLFSTRATQTIKYLCKNSHAWKKANGKLIHKTVKFLTDNENEVHGHSYNADVMPEIEDGCKVRVMLIIMLAIRTAPFCDTLCTVSFSWNTFLHQ